MIDPFALFQAAQAEASYGEVGEQASLLDSKDKIVTVADLTAGRNATFAWMFFGYLGFGVVVELYTNLFYDVIDVDNYSNASLYATAAMSLYSASSFFFSPVFATFSDSIGRKPIFVMAAIVDSLTIIIAGLVPSNAVFISMLVIQGCGDNTYATGMGLLADYVTGTPQGHAGSDDDGWFMRGCYKLVRLGSDSSTITDGVYCRNTVNGR